MTTMAPHQFLDKARAEGVRKNIDKSNSDKKNKKKKKEEEKEGEEV